MRKFLINVSVLLLLIISVTACKKNSTDSNEKEGLPQTGTVTDIDGNVYQTVKIGDQWWMAENLKVTRYRNGDPIPHVTVDSIWKDLTTGAYCNKEYVIDYLDTYGCLYNWYAVNDDREIAPTSWHVASDSDWQVLVDFLGGYDTAGGKLKETGTEHWSSPNSGATNESGFTALPAGYRLGSAGQYSYSGLHAQFWTSTAYDSTSAWYRSLFHNSTLVGQSAYNLDWGLSVRCVKD